MIYLGISIIVKSISNYGNASIDIKVQNIKKVFNINTKVMRESEIGNKSLQYVKSFTFKDTFKGNV